ncbi:hypothetical protein KCU65_g6387, partial [Aureobasidium melanogenum]
MSLHISRIKSKPKSSSRYSQPDAYQNCPVFLKTQTPPRASTKESPSAPVKDSPPTPLEGKLSKPSRPSTTLILWEAWYLPITPSTCLPYGEKFRLNEPRALGIWVPADFDLDRYEMKVHLGNVDFSDKKQVEQLEYWRIREAP